ncbi:MAG TPA: sugar ABC transporter permease [Verrucomicrobiae bacterium]|nr:sugar ABC transporter permease [Verrucomicrobiae bacterium]
MARTKRGRTALAGCLFLLPNLLGFLAFTLIPVVVSLGLSFFAWDLFSPPKFVGIHNFSTLLHDHDFWRYAFNTVFLMLTIPVNIVGSLFLAMVMNQKLRGIVVFRTIYFLPTIVMGVGTYLLWRWIYNPDYGPINTIIAYWFPRWLNDGIRGLGAEWPPQWLASVTWAKPALMFMTFWTVVGGYNMILFLAALQGVSPELYEAADIDGANWWQKFWAITWPLVSPTTFFVFTMSLIGGLQGGFDQAFVMTRGGPAGATTTISYYIYNHAFAWNHMGYAAAMAWVLFTAVFAATMLNWRFGGRVVHY